MSSNASRTPRGKAAGVAAAPPPGDGRSARPSHPGTPRTAAPKAGAPVRDVPRSSKVVWAADRNGNGSARRPSFGLAKPNSPPVSAKAAQVSSSAAPSYAGPPGPSRDAALRARPKATHEQINFNASTSPPGSGRRHSSLSMATSTGLLASTNASSPRTTLLASSSGLAGAASSSDAVPDAEREGSNPSSSPRRRQSEVQPPPAKPPPVKKRGNSSKKRRQTGNSTTRPQPFSFSTDVRKGRRVRPTSVDEEPSTEEAARPKSLGSKRSFAGPKYSSIVQVPVPKRHATPLTPPDSGVSQGGASSSSDHWEPQSPGLPTSGGSGSANPASPGEPASPSAMLSSSSASRLLSARLERPPPHFILPGRGRDSEQRRGSGSHVHEDETPSPGLQGQSGFSILGGSSSTSHLRGRLHQGPEKRASSRDVSPNPGTAAARRSRVSDLRNAKQFGTAGSQQPGSGTLSASSSANSNIGVAAEDASASVAERAGAAALTGHHATREEEDRGGSGSRSRERSNSASGSLERNRSTSILRGRFNAHISRAQAATEAEDRFERERHVSFCADRSNEVVQFSVERSEPTTTRVARRVFGGDLQAHMGNATTTSMRYQVGTGNTTVSSGLAGSMCGGRMPSVERLPNVTHAYLDKYKEADGRSYASLRPGIRDLAPPPTETGPAHL
mmetsp:Transcript_106247/g.193419  ORF Transcript_106247/g.193419 Transcript_106247/m.193419 type:complete len:674 (+) Transcript_106247:267-2288(+)